MATLGDFLPGSVRRTQAEYIKKDGTVSINKAQPVFTYTDAETGKQKTPPTSPQYALRYVPTAKWPSHVTKSNHTRRICLCCFLLTDMGLQAMILEFGAQKAGGHCRLTFCAQSLS